MTDTDQPEPMCGHEWTDDRGTHRCGLEPGHDDNHLCALRMCGATDPK